MADGTIGVRQAANPDRLVDNEFIGDRYRQRVRLGGEALGDLAAVLATAPAADAYGLVVRLVGAAALDAKLDTLHADVDGLEATLAEIRARTTDKGLTERLLAKAPAAGYALWLDTADAAHTYILEAPAATGAGSTGFRGVRIPLDSAGNMVGKVQVNTSATLTFDNRTTDGGWA